MSDFSFDNISKTLTHRNGETSIDCSFCGSYDDADRMAQRILNNSIFFTKTTVYKIYQVNISIIITAKGDHSANAMMAQLIDALLCS